MAAGSCSGSAVGISLSLGDIVVTAGQLKAGRHTTLDAQQDIILQDGAETQNTTGSNTADQKQDTADLSRDTDNANGSIRPVFDKEKEQKRLQQIQVIGDLGGQMSDIIRTQGDIEGLRVAKAENTGITDAAVLRETDAYKTAAKEYSTGSDMQKAAQAQKRPKTPLRITGLQLLQERPD